MFFGEKINKRKQIFAAATTTTTKTKTTAAKFVKNISVGFTDKCLMSK